MFKRGSISTSIRDRNRLQGRDQKRMTTRMLASLLGYPTTCSISGEVHACTLSLTCWLQGGVRVRGCGGGWLLSCCIISDGNESENSIPSSDWTLKLPPKLHQIAKRPVVPANVFRRRVDDDVTQVTDGAVYDCRKPTNLLMLEVSELSRDVRTANRADRRNIVDFGHHKTPFKTSSVVAAGERGRRYSSPLSCQVDCGLPSSRLLQKRIIGGREARFAEFPWQAHVRISEFQCGGVLVSRWYVATAAHCVSRARPREIAVWLGALDTAAALGATAARKIGVVQKVLHPLFQFRMTQPDRYDIALLRLARPVTYMSHILPICLPDYELELGGKSGVIAGWGKTDTSNGHMGTNLLRSATVPILSTEQCIQWHQSKQISVEIHSEMICAGHSDGHQDACLGTPSSLSARFEMNTSEPHPPTWKPGVSACSFIESSNFN
ncbi:Serine proteinase stubble [Eumeta japonica]|uniref:Serine proteinase stubble n=1 Tax=Eumeta variegata TaxID=151549 RepID=A0A4C1XGU7_EUMVA|nr:Serine proteinase stubble [Eumeta japonica]